MTALWRVLTLAAVATLCPDGVIALDLDDTLLAQNGAQDRRGGQLCATRSAPPAAKWCTPWAQLGRAHPADHPPWGGQPLGLPINMRLYRKGGPTHNELAEAMIVEVAGWLDKRTLRLGCDGAYASLAGASLPRTHVVSRMRRDAALYEPAPPRTGKRGRPRKKGARLPTPAQIAAQTKVGWQRVSVDMRGQTVERLLLSRRVLWYRACPDRLVQLVIVRDPDGTQPDDFFFTTDLDAAPAEVAGSYAGRWSIEDTFRNTKQFLGGEGPQTWKGQGPERAAALSLWLSTAVWLWYIPVYGTQQTWPARPWYGRKATPSFADALAALRRVLWRQRITPMSCPGALPSKIADTLIDALAQAA